MVFWRKNKNPKDREEEKRESHDNRPLPDPSDPAMEPPAEHGTEMSEALKQDLHETETEIIEELVPEPVPAHIPTEDAREEEELSDHTEEGGWFSRLTSGLSKSTNKITQGITDLLTKQKLDQDALDGLEEVLIGADLGPRTAAKVIADFSEGRFDKEISEEEIQHALAESMEKILEPVAGRLAVQKPENGPFVILVCGVNGAGKTTTIGKLAHHLKYNNQFSVMMAAGDTFRAAAVEQLAEWSKRVGCHFLAKDVGADAASVAYEAYEKAKAEGIDVLLLDTAGRLQNKANLMEELEKIIRVLKKQDENVPHETLLVLDATTGQNAFSQLETFKEMVNVTGLVVTKLDGSAKGGVLVGLADQFGVPVYAVGVGEGIEDLQPFCPKEFAQALVGVG